MQIMSSPRGQFVSPERDRMRLAMAEGGLLVCSMAGWILGWMRQHQEETLGLAASPVFWGSLGCCDGWMVQLWGV